MNFEIAPKSTEIRANWDNAKLYCFSLNIDGKTGWRLPTDKELADIYLRCRDIFSHGYYWSSQEFNSTHAIDFDFREASINIGSSPTNKENVNLIRAIRDLS